MKIAWKALWRSPLAEVAVAPATIGRAAAPGREATVGRVGFREEGRRCGTQRPAEVGIWRRRPAPACGAAGAPRALP